MPTADQVPDICQSVQASLAAAERNGIYSMMTGDKLEDGWLHIAVEPARAGVKASDHATLMAQIERNLRQSAF